MKYIAYLASLLMAATAPLVVSAQQDPYAFANSLALWGAILIGVFASGMVLYHANRIGGGILGSVYKYFGVGMLLVVLGFVSVVVPVWAPPIVVGRVHDALFVLGYVSMAFGARRIVVAYQKSEVEKR